MKKFVLKIILGVLIFGYLVWQAGPMEIARNLAQFKISALFFINITTLCGCLLGGSGVILLGKNINSRLKWHQGMKGFLGSTSLALFIPGRAGDFTLPFYWKRYMNYGECLSIVFQDKLITLFCVLFLGSYGIYVIFHRTTGFIVASLAISAIVSLLLLFSIPRTRIIISKVLPDKLLDFLQGSVKAFRTTANKGKRTLFTVLILTIVRIFIYGIGFWISLWGLDINAPLLYAILVMTIAQFTALIPISIMGLGPVEAICVYCLAQIDINASGVLAALLVGRIIALFWLSLFFFCFNINRGVNSA